MNGIATAERQRLSDLLPESPEPQALTVPTPPSPAPPVTLATDPSSTKVVVFENVVEHSLEIGEFIAALAIAQGKFKSIERTLTATVDSKRTNTTYTYDYAPLDVVLDAVRPALSEAGIAYMQFPSARPNSVTVITFLAHASGQWFRSRLTVGGPEHGDPQAVKSAVTYARRIAFEAIAGISPAHDDDGGAAQAAVNGSSVRPGKGPVPMPQRDLPRQAAAPAAPADSHAGIPAPPPVPGPQTSAGFTITHCEKKQRANGKGFYWLVQFSNGKIASSTRAEMGAALERGRVDGTVYDDVILTKSGDFTYVEELVPQRKPGGSLW